MVKIQSYFKHDRLLGIEFTEPSMTQQQFADECDLNNIVDHNMRYKDPGFVTRMMLQGRLSDSKPIYGDFTSVGDYQKSLETIRIAQEQFNALPAKTRDKFNNNPIELLEFVNNTDNYASAVELGLIEPIELKQTSQEAGSKVDVEPISGLVNETSAQAHT